MNKTIMHDSKVFKATRRMELPLSENAKATGAAHFRRKFGNPIWYIQNKTFKWRCKDSHICEFEKQVGADHICLQQMKPFSC